jgi:redox-regulated HSP33 family molecular chaperone
VLLTIDVNDYEGKLLVATVKENNEKDLNNRLSLIRNLSAINFNEIKIKGLLARMVRKISCFSEVGFISSLIPKDNIEVNEQKVLSLFIGLSREELIKLFEENNEIYLSGCCNSCQEDF